MKKYLAIVAVLMLTATLVVGCEGVPSATVLPPGMGMLKIYVTDPPPPDMEEVLVTIKGLEIHKDGGSWETVTVDKDTHQFNLLDLIGIQEFLASKVVDAGRYTQIRLDIEEVKIKVVGEENYHYAKVPSGKIKLVGTFVVPENGVTEITLDFNGEKSVLVTGNGEYHFKPVIKLLVSEPMGLETHGDDATAEWTDEIEPGNYPVKLYVGDGGANMVAVVFEVDIALQDINILSFRKWVSAYGGSGWNPSIILGIDADGDGQYEAPDDLGWHFTHDPSDLGDDAFIEGEFPTGLTATDTDWVAVDAITEMKWWGADASGNIYPTAGYAALNATDGFQETSAGVIDPTDHVKVVKIIIGGSGSWMNETAYVDDFVVAGP